MAKRVVVGLSGGVDSSVAAYLLKQQGYEVIAVFMVNWHDKTGVLDADCPWDEDVIFAEMVARKIGIPFHVEDLSVPYKKRVIDYMFAEYEKGRTPNPDVLCNREIKFDEFIRATKKYAPDYVATGHYCKKEEFESKGRKIYRLMAGDDPAKEQSYFLCQLTQKQLAKTLFPIGHLQKSEVRKIAREQKLASAEKRDSQGICFVGKVHLPEFLQQKLESKEGNIFEIPLDSPLYRKENKKQGEVSAGQFESTIQRNASIQQENSGSAKLIEGVGSAKEFEGKRGAVGGEGERAEENARDAGSAEESEGEKVVESTEGEGSVDDIGDTGLPKEGKNERGLENSKGKGALERSECGKEPGSENLPEYPDLSELKSLSEPLRYKISDGTYVGKHRGAHFFTIGQRKGLQVGGKKEPLFVIATDVVKNRIFVGQGKSHPGLYRRGLHILTDEIHWVRHDLAMQPGEKREYMVRIRYRQDLERARLYLTEKGMYIIFEKPQRGVAAGQFAAWYDDGELIGSGVINQ
ncbi:MAG: tRNA 2-thiouridine(34) synthase MnmA [Bacteroidales bacterium]